MNRSAKRDDLQLLIARWQAQLTLGYEMFEPPMYRGPDRAWKNDQVILVDHPASRSRTLARHCISAGTIVTLVPALSAVLLDGEKSKRCDFCFRLPQDKVRKCTGCAEYWYCGPICTRSVSFFDVILPLTSCRSASSLETSA